MRSRCNSTSVWWWLKMTTGLEELLGPDAPIPRAILVFLNLAGRAEYDFDSESSMSRGRANTPNPDTSPNVSAREEIAAI